MSRKCSAFAFLLLCVISRLAAAAPLNDIQVENALPGTTSWQLTSSATGREIEGYASATSVQAGGSIKLYVNTSDPMFSFEVYRMGWYNGAGGRLVFASVLIPGVKQAMPVPDEFGMMECKWTPSWTLAVPAVWTSGVYLVKLKGSTSGRQSYIIFVVRNKRSASLLFVSSVTTYQAYNNWGGRSLYDFNSGGYAARKVSFNRPYGQAGSAIGMGAGDFIEPPVNRAIGWEYNMVRFLEREGYDVAYITSVDVHEDGAYLQRTDGILSVGHDEYWSWDMRANITAARDKGVNLAFFSANVCYWQIRFEADSAKVADRTIVCYKLNAPAEDPQAKTQYITTLWRRNPALPPEEALVGVMYAADPVSSDITIYDQNHWALAKTGLKKGDILPGVLGYEVDITYGSHPANTELIGHSWFTCPSDLAPGTVCPSSGGFYSDMVSYQARSGATVFATGSIQWSWGLDNFRTPIAVSPAVQQITRNVLARLQQ